MIKVKKEKQSFVGSKSRAEKLGYVPVEQRINALISAGQNLIRSRLDFYDTSEVDPDILAKPGRTFGIDLADLSDLHRRQAQRVNEIKERIRQERAVKKAMAGDYTEYEEYLVKNGTQQMISDFANFKTMKEIEPDGSPKGDPKV